MGDLFDFYEYSSNIFDEYPAAESSDWLHQADSGSPLIKFSQGSFEMVAASDAEEKVCISTGISLHEEFILDYGLVADSHQLEEPHSVEATEPETDPSMPMDIEYRPRTEKRLIDISTGAICRKSRIEKGDRFQTKNICKHLHTETARFLKDGLKLHQFQSEQIEHIRNFCQSKISIDSFKTLLRHPKISAFVRKYYESRYYVKEVMGSKMEMRAKLTMIKYLERIRSIAYDKNFKAWKKDSKEFQ